MDHLPSKPPAPKLFTKVPISGKIKPRQDDSNVLLSGLVSGHFTSILRVLETEYSLNYWAERSVCLLGHVC